MIENLTTHKEEGVTGAAGELGLFQLKLATANEIGAALQKAQGVEKPVQLTKETVRDDNALNTTLGTQHLQNLLTRFGGNVRNALGAYKQGAKSVTDRGLSDASEIYADAVLHCESILRM
jgi:soluble lytic murein transglycosylase-like protein